MSIEPLKNLPLSRPTGSGQPGRAQDFSTINLGRESIKGAKVSMNQAMGGSSKRSTSISHPEGASDNATTSITRTVEAGESLNGASASEEERDEKRYNFIRRLVKERQAKEKEKEEELKKTGVGVADVYGNVVEKAGFSAGKLSRMTGTQGMRMKLRRAVMKSPATYKNLSTKDREYILNLIGSHASKLSTGGKFGRLVRKSMKSQVQKDWSKGIISKQDVDDFKHMIDRLPH